MSENIKAQSVLKEIQVQLDMAGHADLDAKKVCVKKALAVGIEAMKTEIITEHGTPAEYFSLLKQIGDMKAKVVEIEHLHNLRSTRPFSYMRAMGN